MEQIQNTITALKKKTQFTMSFCPNISNNRTGTQYGPLYDVDLRSLVEPADMGKTYKVRFAFTSIYISSAELDNSLDYFINFSFGPNSPMITSNVINPPEIHGIMFTDTFITSSTGPNYLVRFNTKMTDNPPIIINSLYGVSRIGWQVYSQGTSGSPVVYNPANNDGTIYAIKLYFEEA